MEERLLRSRGDIARYNAALVRTLGESARLYELAGFCRRIAREEIEGWIARETPEAGAYFCGTRAVTAGDWAGLLENRALGALCSREPRWGICVRRCAMRALPTCAPLTARRDDRFDDRLQLTALADGEPLAVFHESADGRYYFAAAYCHMGWVAAADVGLCGFAAWRAAQEGDFLRVTGSRVLLCADGEEPRVSARVVTMGTRLALAEPVGTLRAVRSRVSYDAYIARLPVRETDGALGFAEALVPVSAAVCVGDVPYTALAAVRLAEATRGEVYGWGGLLGSRDCSALVGEVYRCFGFRLPRNARDLARLPDGIDLAPYTSEEKRERLRALPAGAVLYFPGHCMLWLGERGGEPMCLSAAGSFRPAGSPAAAPRAVNTCAVTPLTVVRASGETWLEALERAVVV